MKRVVIKVGTHVLTEQNRLARDRIMNLISFIVELMKRYEVILVSSGAVAAGYTKIKLNKQMVENKQTLCAVGQPYLMSVYQKKLERLGFLAGQVLLTADDFDSRKRTQNAKRAIETMLKYKILPIINENDTTAIEELVFGDNDQLSAHATYYFDADLLVILSDIDGYYDKDPKKNEDAKILKVVNEIDNKDLEDECSTNHAFATGGIVTKLKAADFLLKRGRSMFLSSGFDLKDARSFLLEGKHFGGTLFTPKENL